jgi:hypothetical protein
MKILGLLLSILFSGNLLAAICSDDPRLYVMRSVIDDLAAGKTVPPLKLMPMTYLNLNSNLRKKLGDNILVMNQQCVPVQVVDGHLPTRAIVSYEDLLYGLFSATSAQDDEAVNIILNSFQAAPRSTQDIFYLIRELEWPAQQLEVAQKLGVLPLPKLHNNHESCKNQVGLITHVELYERLGGKSSDGDYIYRHLNRYGDNNYYSRQLNSKKSHTHISDNNFIINGCQRHEFYRIADSLVSIGITTPSGDSMTEFFNLNPAPKVNTDG